MGGLPRIPLLLTTYVESLQLEWMVTSLIKIVAGALEEVLCNCFAMLYIPHLERPRTTWKPGQDEILKRLKLKEEEVSFTIHTRGCMS